jgi:acyl-CoA reductase-like NAD-dependent aldehyde dehydrogenase
VNPVASPFFNFSVPEPCGVVGVVAPKSSPLLGLLSLLLPVLVPGNTAVVAVENVAPTVSLDLGEVLATSDVPAGVVNLLTAPRAELLPHLAAHRDVDALACAGLADGERTELQRAAADSVKRVRVFEDGGRERWLDPALQSPWRIEPFVEWKTAWHPIGV